MGVVSFSTMIGLKLLGFEALDEVMDDNEHQKGKIILKY